MWSRPLTRRPVATLLTGTVLALCSPKVAHAEPSDLAAAETLFEQGRKLLAAGNLDEGCPKFAESHRLAPAAGTALNLGLCYEKQNKVASAWGAFQEALALSTGTGQQERAKLARERATALEPRLSRLIVVVPPASDAPGLEVRRDGVAMARAQWGSAIPVDAGSHVIEASAKDKTTFRTTIEITSEGSTDSFTLPPLADQPRSQASVEPSPGSTRGGGALRVIGIGTAVIGAGLIGTGAVFALSSSSKSDELEAHARNGGAWGPDQSATFDDGKSAATVANVLFVTGAIVLVGGGVLTVLGFTAPRPSATALMPTVGGLKCAF